MDEFAVETAEATLRAERARLKADEVAAFYRRLRGHRVPEPAAREFTTYEFYPWPNEAAQE